MDWILFASFKFTIWGLCWLCWKPQAILVFITRSLQIIRFIQFFFSFFFVGVQIPVLKTAGRCGKRKKIGILPGTDVWIAEKVQRISVNSHHHFCQGFSQHYVHHITWTWSDWTNECTKHTQMHVWTHYTTLWIELKTEWLVGYTVV